MAQKDVIPFNPVTKMPNDGALTKFIPQTSHSFMDSSRGTKRIETVFKGPVYNLEPLDNKLEEMLAAKNDESFDDASFFQFWQTTGNFIDWNSSYYQSQGANVPIYMMMLPMTTQGSKSYILDSWKIEECDAGKHCIFRIWWQYQATSTDPIKPDEVYWTCTMQPTQVNVLAYCSNRAKQGETGAPGADKGTYATRIQTWMNQPTDTAELKPEYKFQNIIGTDKIEELNSAEIAIAKKLEAGQNPLRHYPVVVKHEIYLGKPQVDFDLIDYVVTRTEMDDGTSSDEKNPFKDLMTAGKWEFLCTGINVEYHASTDTTKVTTEFTGSRIPEHESHGWDQNFYGKDNNQGADRRWEFGKVFDDTSGA